MVATRIPRYTQKARLIFGGNPVKDKSHGLPPCWAACGGVLWCSHMVPVLLIAFAAVRVVQFSVPKSAHI
jgi:hypothetical protein